MLTSALKTVPVTILFGLIVLSSIYWLYTHSTSELAPQEDQGVILYQMTTAPTATLEQRSFYDQQVYGILEKEPQTNLVFQIDTPSQIIGGWVLKAVEPAQGNDAAIAADDPAEVQRRRRRAYGRLPASPAAGSNGCRSSSC